MGKERLPFRLIIHAGGQVALSGYSFQLRIATAPDLKRLDTVLEIVDVTHDVAVRVAESFVAGWQFGSLDNSRRPLHASARQSV
ncbi:MAG: hypothetical protein HC834_10160 [Rhodospirillales bacterium]|nr:hypothetical protein [Rhodospirillales bacterium]